MGWYFVVGPYLGLLPAGRVKVDVRDYVDRIS